MSDTERKARTGQLANADPEEDGDARAGADRDKARSRGVSRDMSPDAIARRLDIVSELRDLALSLGQAKKTGTNRRIRPVGNKGM